MGLVDGIVKAAVTREQMRRDMRGTLGADSLGGILDQFKRRARSPLELEKLATTLGLRYSRWQQLGLIDGALPLYRDGREREIESVVHGVVAGVPLALFDYEYVVSGQTERHYTCAQIGLPGPVSGLRAVPGSEPETDDPVFATAVLDPSTEEWLRQGHPSVEYQTGGHWALVASPPIVLEKWEGFARRAIVWAGRVAAVRAQRARVV